MRNLWNTVFVVVVVIRFFFLRIMSIFSLSFEISSFSTWRVLSFQYFLFIPKPAADIYDFGFSRYGFCFSFFDKNLVQWNIETHRVLLKPKISSMVSANKKKRIKCNHNICQKKNYLYTFLQWNKQRFKMRLLFSLCWNQNE